MKQYLINYTIIIAVLSFMVFSCAPTEQFLIKRQMQQKSHKTGDETNVRILIAKTDGKITISSDFPIRMKDKQNGSPVGNPENKWLVITPSMIDSPVTIESDSPLSLGEKSYRGVFELQNVKGTLYVINILRMDEYLYSVVPGEIQANWPVEALKAQSVAARSYAYYHIVKNNESQRYDLDASNNYQVYKGMFIEKPSTTKAVDSTSGTICTYFREPIIAYFHSTCGGRTIDDKYVWNWNDLHYLQSVKCRYCKDSKNFNWEATIPLNQIHDRLAVKNPGIGPIRGISFKKFDGRVSDVIIIHSGGSIKMNGNNFRLLFPNDTIRSLYFDSVKNGQSLVLTGHGWGHGVGMCQWGAKGLAEKGAHYKTILRYYYKDIQFNSIDETAHHMFAEKETNRSYSN